MLLTLVLIVALVAGTAAPAMAISDVRLVYDLNVAGNETTDAGNTYVAEAKGETVTVNFTVLRTDSTEAYDLATMQNEIEYDMSFFELVGTPVSEARTNVFAQTRTTQQQIIKSSVLDKKGFAAAGVVFCTFQLKIKSDTAQNSGWVRCSEISASETPGQYIPIRQRNLIVSIGGTAPETYTVTFDAGEGSMVGAAPGTTYVSGNEITLPNAERSGFILWGWRDSETQTVYQKNSKTTDTYTATHNATMTAVWGGSVAFNANAGTLAEGAENPMIAMVGSSVVLPSASKDGSEFLGWSDGSATYAAGSSYPVTGNTSLTAQWGDGSVALTFNVNGGTLSGSAPATVPVGQSISLPSATRVGYQFAGWSDGTTVYMGTYPATAAGSVTLTAQWTVCAHDGAKSYGSGSVAYSHIAGTHTHNVATTRNVTCAVCGEVLTPETTNETVNCTGANVTNYLSNATQHWHRCDVCGDFEVGNHSFVNGVCSVCGYGTPTEPGGGTTTIVDDEVPLADVDSIIVTTLVDPTTGASVSGARDEDGHIAVTVLGPTGDELSSVRGGVRVSFTLRAGEVAILLDKDGKEIELLEKSIVECQTAYVLVDGSCVIDIKYNAKPFEDVMPYDWFNSAVVFASSHELFNGVAEGVFAPNMPMTRGMLVTVLWRLENKPEDFGANIFPDVADGTWYTEAVEWASKNGIVLGYGDGSFRPDQSITRQEMAAMLYRYMNYLGYDMSARGDLSTFNDADQVGDWALENVQWANGAGIITGKDGNRIDPLGNATRAEVATMLMRIVTNMVK